MNEPIEFYHYLDENGLDSLYAQCADFIVERSTELAKGRDIDGEGEIEIGKLMSLVGLGGAKVEGKISLNRLRTESMKSVSRIEQRIPIILSYLEKNNRLQRLTDSSEAAKSGYTLIEESFKAPDFQEVLQKSNSDSQTGFVEFTCKSRFGSITMGTSIRKYKTSLQQLVPMWRGPSDRSGHVRLSVFGYLQPDDKQRFYLKPFAIAQA